jgi:ribosomal protein S18 acetylase RimI-like enzyme
MTHTIEKLKSAQISSSILENLVAVHRNCFPEDAKTNFERKLILQSWNQPPLMNYWVLHDTSQHKIIGYIRYVEHGGMRQKAVIELEQIGILEAYREQGLATLLIDTSLFELTSLLQNQNRSIKLIYVSTGSGNPAQKLYHKALGAKIVATIPGFYEDNESTLNEVIMLAIPAEIECARKARELTTLAKSLL